MITEPKTGEKVQLSDLAGLFPDEYVFATEVDNNHPDFPNDFWIHYDGHCKFEQRSQMRKELAEKGFRTHWYRTTPNKEFTSIGALLKI